MRLRSAAHPRAGGENSQGGPAQASARGSSPRGRGKPCSPGGIGSWVGLIPARAGKTTRGRRRRWPCPAHPRAGGENFGVPCRFRAIADSSPRGRGKRGWRRKGQHVRRLIPARAGKTSATDDATSADSAHPRAGGENMIDLAKPQLTAGSSPRGRGKRPHVLRRQHHRGLIPAWAGKTHPPRDYPRRARAHPRAGGENSLDPCYVGNRQGSSPRGRGKQARQGIYARVPRLIPARAGKTT